MASHNPFSFIGSKDEVAITFKRGDKERVILAQNPTLSAVSVHRSTNERFHTMDGRTENFPLTNPSMEIELTLETFEWEMISGQDLDGELPEVVDDMSVEELLDAVNRKLEQHDD